MIRFAFPENPDLLLADARRVESEFKKKYLRGMHASLGDAQGYASASEPRLSSVYPTSGPTGAAVPVSLHGENLGKAVSRGEITLLVTMPRALQPQPLK